MITSLLRRAFFIGALLLIAWGVLRMIPAPPFADHYSSSTAVFDREHQLLRLTLSADEKYRIWTQLEHTSPALIEAVLLHEDRHFYHHPGVNPVSLLRAVSDTYLSGGRRVGGSTITMQLARLHFGIPSHTVRGKIVQIVRSCQLELRYSKDQILEAYLNLLPYSNNIEGTAAASLIYFNKSMDRLTLPEILTLAVIPQSPARRSPQREDTGALQESRLRLFEQWVSRHPQDRNQDARVRLPIAMGDVGRLPFHAPHFVTTVLSRHGAGGGIETTLDRSLQRTLERQIQAYIATQRHLGITNAAAMLIDVRSMEVKALVGSADFFDTAIQGQVNGALAKRSPGSTLKPALYALAIDQGLIHSQTLLKDTPVSFGGFNPENFDNHFVGPISAKEALIRSRNVPALTLAAKLSAPTFYEFLKHSEVHLRESERYYGLGLALGGGGVTMEELVGLYAAIGNNGVWRPMRYRQNDSMSAGKRLLSAEASFMILDILKDNPRPDQQFSREWVKHPMHVAWKTGTSFGYRDAWSVGLFEPYALAVWIGNFSGEGNPAFIGIQAAAPLFFQIIDAVTAEQKLRTPAAPLPPPGVAKVEVCAVSGQLPGPYCPVTKPAWFIPGKSPIQMCTIHRAVTIDVRTGIETCSGSNKTTRTEVFEFWPSDMLTIFKLAGIPRRVPPRSADDCFINDQATRGTPPVIISPKQGLHYTVRANAVGKEVIPFQSAHDADVREVFWFVNGHFAGKVYGNQPLMWTAQPGRYIVRAVDNLGRTDSRELYVSIVR
jgi:penicillin-binding protein 1C